MSSRRAAGSKRNKKYKFVGTRKSDGLSMRHPTFDYLLKPDHKARAIDPDTFRNQVKGFTLVAAEHVAESGRDTSRARRITVSTARWVNAKLKAQLGG